MVLLRSKKQNIHNKSVLISGTKMKTASEKKYLAISLPFIFLRLEKIGRKINSHWSGKQN